MKRSGSIAALTFGLGVVFLAGGCPGTGVPLEFVAGGIGDVAQIADAASVQVFTPASDLAITGGAPIEVNWRAVGTQRTASVRIFFDVDLDPQNDNEITADSRLPLSETSITVDTSDLPAGRYAIGVVVEEVGQIVAQGYAPAVLTVNQRPQFFYTSPRDHQRFDRTEATNPRFDVAWTVFDPDSVVSVQIFLDPDSTPNGNEILLRESDSQTGDTFAFDLPTASFEAGTYRLLALVSDGVDTFPFYAATSIHLRARLAGFIDLRDIGLPSSPVSGALFEGFQPRDNAGSFVSTMRDLDGDGFAEFIILSQFGKPSYFINTSRTGIGEGYIIYGRADRFRGLINLNSTGTLFRGEIFSGVPEVVDPIRPSRGITSFATLTDWDGDGVREMAFGVPFVDSFPQTVLDGSGYFRSGAVIVVASSCLRPDQGYPGGHVYNLAHFGTVPHTPNDDDFPPDCPEGLTGPKAPTSASGSTYWERHVGNGVTGVPNSGSVRLGCRFSSADPFDQFGETVSRHDFDGLIVSAPNRDPFFAAFAVPESVPGGGVVSVYFNSTLEGFYPWTSVNAPVANEAFNYPGVEESQGLDLLPHDGPYHYIVDDVRGVLAPGASFFMELSPGYTVDRDDAVDPCEFAIDGRMDFATEGIVFWSGNAGGRMGNAIGIDDFNADGLLDLMVGNSLSNNGAGVTLVLPGRPWQLVRGGVVQLEELELPMNAGNPSQTRVFDSIRVVGNPGDRLGQSQDNAGDFNSDGIPDIIIGSPLVNNRSGGAAVFFGSRDVVNLTRADIPFDELDDRGLGVIFVGEEEGDLAGARVGPAGDVDGDGNDDILIAAPNRSVALDIDSDGTLEIDRTNCGVVYLIYGSPELSGTLNLADVGTERLPGAVFVGRNSADFLGAGLGEQGDRSRSMATAQDVDGDGRDDLLLGSVSASPRDRVRAGEVYLIYGAGD